MKLITNIEIGLEYELAGGGGLVQAFGELFGVEIYFRAKHNEWTFDIAGEDGKLSSDGGTGGYFREAKLKRAGYMTLKEAEQIILECVTGYLKIHNIT